MRTFSNPPSMPSMAWDGVVAPGRDPGRQRSGQRPLGGGDPVDHRRGGRGAGGPAAVGARDATPSSRSSRTGPTWSSAFRSASAWATAWPASSCRIGPRACFWGGYGGSVVVMDQRDAPHRRLRDEPDGGRAGRRLPRRRDHHGCRGECPGVNVPGALAARTARKGSVGTSARVSSTEYPALRRSSASSSRCGRDTAPDWQASMK